MVTSATIPQTARPKGRASFLQRALSGDGLALGLTFTCATLILAITALLVWELWSPSALSRAQFGLKFLYTSAWDPVAQRFGALPFIYGTVMTSALSLLI